MNDTQLSNRLARVASYVIKGARLADIGSDHAYLPCYLAQQDVIAFGIAGEVVSGPFESAKSQILKSGVEERVEARFGDGLAVLSESDQIDTISICGMGGDLISKILSVGLTNEIEKHVRRLILQPNNAEPLLRHWLIQNGYTIVQEEIIEENKKRYEIIVAEKSTAPETYTNEDFLFGKFLRTEKNEVFVAKWKDELDKYQYVLSSLEKARNDQSQKTQEILSQMRTIQEELT